MIGGGFEEWIVLKRGRKSQVRFDVLGRSVVRLVAEKECIVVAG